jgi:hypothetical protein
MAMSCAANALVESAFLSSPLAAWENSNEVHIKAHTTPGKLDKSVAFLVQWKVLILLQLAGNWSQYLRRDLHAHSEDTLGRIGAYALVLLELLISQGRGDRSQTGMQSSKQWAHGLDVSHIDAITRIAAARHKRLWVSRHGRGVRRRSRSSR